jgi:hypothetical protein
VEAQSFNMNFKENFGIPAKQPVEFLNIPLNGDLEAFIDPFLIANNIQDPMIKQVHSQMIQFLTKLNREFIVPNDRVNGLPFLDNLHEPNEYHLGYSDSNKGKAISRTRAEVIFQALRGNRFAKVGISITNEAHNVLLLVTGIGQDIMSDTIANVCRDIFAKFTYNQCLLHRIPTDVFKMYYYNAISKQWENSDLQLPSYKGKPIILLPNKIVSSPRGYTSNFNNLVARNHISKDILSGKIGVNEVGVLVKTLKDGTRKAIIKRIVEEYGRPKDELIQFVLDYPGSLEEFLDYAKEHYPAIDLSDLD